MLKAVVLFSAIGNMLLTSTCGATQLSIETYSSEFNEFNLFCSSSLNKVIDCDDGYAYLKINGYEADFTSRSKLILVESILQVTPGIVANDNGMTQEDGSDYKNYYLYKGYYHIKCLNYEDEDLNQHTGTTTYLACWPSSTMVTTEVSSTTGLEISFNFGTSNEVEISSGISFKLGTSNSMEISISNSRTVSSTFSDPSVSQQMDSQDSTMATWNYTVTNVSPAGSETFTMTTYYLFEYNRFSSSPKYEGQIPISYEVQFQNQYYILWWLAEGCEFSYTASTYLVRN